MFSIVLSVVTGIAVTRLPDIFLCVECVCSMTRAFESQRGFGQLFLGGLLEVPFVSLCPHYFGLACQKLKYGG